MATNIRYIDYNRGLDSNNGWTPSTPWKTLSMMSNFDPGNSGDGGIYLASDSVWTLDQTLASSGYQVQTRFNGLSGHQSFIMPYVPSGGDTGTMPTITKRMIPVPADWTWDSTLNYGVAKGWYLQFAYAASHWDVLVEVNGVIVETTNQDTTNNTGLGYINGVQNGVNAGNYVNGMTYDTLRFNFDWSGANVNGATGARLYLSGLGLHTSGAGNDPSSVYGPGAIKVAFGQFWSFYDSLNYTTISGIRCAGGGGLLIYQGTADTIRQGFEMTGCTSYDTVCPVRINSGTGSVATTKWTVDIHDNRFDRLTGPAFLGYGIGVSGYYRNNIMTNGNLASSMGGGVYCQLKPSTVDGTATPFRVEKNVADTWKNGAGNNTWDGGCYYADIQDEGTIFSHNVAQNSYVAYQCGSGKRSEWYGNLSINCEYAGLFNNAPSVDAQDYVFAHNLHIAAPRGTFKHGEAANNHLYTFVVYQSGTAANMVGGKIMNNVFINNPAQPAEVPVLAWSDVQWSAGKVRVQNNAFIGYGDRLVVSEFNVTNRTSSVTSIVTTQAAVKFVDANYRISAGSSLFAAGSRMTDVAVLNARDGTRYYDPPSIGPHEPPRKSDWFSSF